MSEWIKVAVDAMGGDYAPQEPVKGAVDAVNDSPELFVWLVGKEAEIRRELGEYRLDPAVLNESRREYLRYHRDRFREKNGVR